MTSTVSIGTFTVPSWEGWYGLGTRTKARLPPVDTVLKKEGGLGTMVVKLSEVSKT